MTAGKRQLKIEILGDAASALRAFSDVDKGGDGLAGKLAKVGTAVAGVATAAGGAALAAGGALFKLGSTFDDAFDTIRVGTGATGEALGALQADFKAVVKDVPTDFASAATAIADLNTRTGATGPQLQDLSKRILELTRLTGGDLATTIAGTTRLFGDWGISTDKQGDTLDKLFRASQATGITVERLAEQMVQFGAPMRELGFSFDMTAGLLAKFEKEGVNAELVMGGLKQGLGRLAKAGKDPQAELRQLMTDIDKAGLTAENKSKVFEMFGARAGIDMAKAIEEGRFKIGELLTTIESGDETILGAAADTADFAEQWTKFKNRVLVTLEPLATRVFGAIGDLMERIGPTAERVIGQMIAKADELMPIVIALVQDGFARLSAWWDENGPTVLAALAQLRDMVVDAGERIVGAVSWVADNWDRLQAPIKVVAGLIATLLIPHYIALGVESVKTAAKNAKAWAVKSTAALRHGAQILATIGRVIAQGAVMAAKAVAHAARVVAAWAMTAAAAVAQGAVHVAQVGIMVAKWAFLGVQSLLHAAKVAAAWLIAMGPIGLVIAAVVGLVALIVANWDTIKRWTGQAWDWVVSKISGAWEWIKGAVAQGFDFLKNLFLNFTPLGLFIKHFDDIVAFITGLPGKIRSAASGMWDGITAAFKAAVNWIIRAWNRIEFRIPGFSLGPVKFDGFTLGLPDIPMLAKGGVTTGPTLAVLGDNPSGREAIVPLERAGEFGFGMGGGLTLEVPVVLDGREVARATVRYTRDELLRLKTKTRSLGLA